MELPDVDERLKSTFTKGLTCSIHIAIKKVTIPPKIAEAEKIELLS